MTAKATEMVKGMFDPLLTGRLLNLQPEKLKDSKSNTCGDLASVLQKFDEGVNKVFSTSKRRANRYIKFQVWVSESPTLKSRPGVGVDLINTHSRYR